MPLSWLQLARDGAPPASERTTQMIKENARKVFGEQPTVSPDGELIVKGAVFKPRKKPAVGDATPAARSSPPPVARVPAATSRTPAKAPRAKAPSATVAAAPRPTSVFPTVSAQQRGVTEDASDDDDNEEAVAHVASYYELMEELTTRHNCDAVRRKIQRFLARKTMSQVAFLREIKVNHNSFTKFMSYLGRDKGHNNKTYQAALLFLHENEPESVPVRNGQPPRPLATAASSASNKEPKMSRREQNLKADVFLNKVNSVALSEPVYVYDDCDDVRKKLHELIESKTVTQAALMKHLGVTTNPLRRFLTTKGKREGCSINVYKLAYVMFERLRIAQGQPKTNKRLQTEKDRPEGYSLKRDPTHYYLVAGETLPPELMRP